jgi:hypothetical protein
VEVCEKAQQMLQILTALVTLAVLLKQLFG